MGVSQVVTYPQSVSIVWLKTQQPGKSSDALPAPDIVLHDSLRGTSVLRWCDLLPCVFSHKQTNLMILQCFPAFLCSASPLIKWLTMVMMKAAIDFLFFCEIVYQDLKKTWVSEWVSDRHGKPMVALEDISENVNTGHPIKMYFKWAWPIHKVTDSRMKCVYFHV